MKPSLSALPCLVASAAPALADTSVSDALPVGDAPLLLLDTAAVYRQDPAPPADTQKETPAAPQWGLPGSWWVTLGAGVAHNLSKDTDYNASVAFSTFLAKELEFVAQLDGWYFAQEGTDTGGINPNMIFRWHFLHDDNFKWTIYGDAGIGLLFSFDDVPSGGTSVNFTPRIGVGYTHLLTDDGLRLQLGLRYHHISNGRIQGDDQNPGRDSVMFYVGITFPL